jgi:hypothetical protein
MIIRILKLFALILIIAQGLMFVSGVYVLGNREAAIEMHEDLAPTASAFMANVKVILSFIVGILYLITAYGIIRKKYSLALAGVIGFIGFDGFYLVELAMWAKTNPWTWICFCIFGTVGFLIGAYSLWVWSIRNQ